MARVFKNFCPSAQDKSVLLRLHKKGVPTQLSTWQLAPFWHRQDKPLDQSRKKKKHLHPGQWLAHTHSSTKAKSENSRCKITSECAIRAKPTLRREGCWVREGDGVVVDVEDVEPHLAVGGHHIVTNFCHMGSCPGDQGSVGVKP